MFSLTLSRTTTAIVSAARSHLTRTPQKSGGWTWGQRASEPEFDGIVFAVAIRQRRVVIAIPKPEIFVRVF